MSLARFSVKNATVLHLMLAAVVVIGAVSLARMPRELMTDIQFNWVFASAIYPGASAEEVERSLTLPMEESIRGVDGVRSVESRSKEGFNFLNIAFEEMPDRLFDKRYREAKDALEQVDLPDDAELVFADAFSSSDFMPIVNVVLATRMSERELKRTAELMERDIDGIRGVADVQIGGVRERVIHVEVDPVLLSATGLPISAVGQALKAANTSLPGGTLDAGGRSVLIQTTGQFGSLDELEGTVIGRDMGGGLVRVRDVGRVVDGWEDAGIISRFNGAQAVTFSISKQSKASSTDIVDQVRAVAARWDARLAGKGAVVITGDTTVQIRDTLSVLVNNAVFGFLLVVLVLWVALGIRNALITALGIPVTFLIAFIFMDATGQSVNGNALFGLVLVLGIIVDDAIVVLENVHRHQLMGKRLVRAVIDGTTEVITPVTAAILTTIAAFLPLMLMPGVIGKFMKIVPIVVSLTLAASLLESLVLIPAHIVSWGNRDPSILQRREHWFEGISAWYERPLRWITRPRTRVAVTISVYLFMVPFSIAITFVVGQDLFRAEEIPQVFAHLRMPETNNLDATDQVIRDAEQRCGDMPDLVNLTANSGLMQTQAEWFVNSSVGQLIYDFKRQGERENALPDLRRRIRECLQGVVGPVSVEVVQVEGGPPVGADVEIKVQGDNWDQLNRIVSLLERHLETIPGVNDVRNNFLPGKEELRVRVDEDRAALLGVSEIGVATALRAGFAGDAATVYRVDDDEFDVLVRYSPEARNDPEWLGRTLVPTAMGGLVPLEDVADISFSQGLSAVRRFDFKRTVTISASLDRAARITAPLLVEGAAGVVNESGVTMEQKVTPVYVTRSVRRYFATIAQGFPGYSLDFTGQFQEFQESFESLTVLALVGMFLIYIILGAQFRSSLQPLIIMGFTFPGALLGSSMGLLFSGNPFSITTMYALIGLLGIVVNDSLVLVSFINLSRERGMTPLEACVHAAKVRLRPIMLTTVTTVFGLLPMGLGLAGESATWGPLASTVVWGLSFATLTTLFIIPPVYMTIEDLKRLALGSRYREDIVSEEVRELEAMDAEERSATSGMALDP